MTASREKLLAQTDVDGQYLTLPGVSRTAEEDHALATETLQAPRQRIVDQTEDPA